ncbi:hypothetical protein [Streptococcus sanguinis]|uniref:Uncharacterized protein n=1 Tax=Streptococcus sanguinis TaxID=1305 RepID=A0ABD4VK77_STRSA|nr:hypothetical protein [Streptococcus sanguinis]MCY7035031.1 hypothetical protein [Streptococcus sanguinis]
MFPMTAKTIMTEEAYSRFAWTNFWYKKNGIFSLILPEIVVLICGAICFFIGEPLPGAAFLVIVAIIDKPETFYIMVGRSMGLILDKADCQPELIDFLLKLKESRSL